MISWGIRMALSGTLPVIWGLSTGRLNDAIWITLTAEAVSWVEMKGSFGWRLRTLLSGAILAIIFAILGTVVSNSLWLSVLCMFVVGFIGSLLKDLGDRASGLAICVYLLFIICNAYPETQYAGILHRMTLVAIGAVWPVLVGVIISLFMPAGEPFRRQIALIWRSISELVGAISRSGNDKTETDVKGDVYVKERDVRTAIDNSYQFYGRMAHQVDKKDNVEYQLAQLRKVAGVVAVNVIAMGEEMAHIAVSDLDETLRVKAATLFSALKEAVSRISIFVITLKPEEKLLAGTQISRLKRLVVLIREYPLPADERQVNAIKRILQLTERTIRLLENAILRVDKIGRDMPVYRSYSFMKTMFLLKPKYFLNSLRVLFNFNSFTTRFAIRSAVAATAAMFLYKWYNVDHGYWLPFSVMIIIQPYFGATITRAIDRVVGTLLGGIAGGLLLYLPAGLHAKEAILFLTFILMVYYVRRQYAVATFVVTLNLVLLFSLEASYSNMIMIVRALCTVGGALLALVCGFALLPTWDKKWLPTHLASAVYSNYNYFIATFFSAERLITWTKSKRIAESRNSNVFDSFNRYMQEPGKEKSDIFYDLIIYNVRVTRNLNNIHLEQDEKNYTQLLPATALQQGKINECLSWFNKVITRLPSLDKQLMPAITEVDESFITPFRLNDMQMINLEKLIIELKTMYEDIQKLEHIHL